MERRGSGDWWAVVAVVLLLPIFTGCGNFFPPINGGGGSGGGTTANRVYIANQAANSIGAFAIGTGTLAAVNNSPLATSYKPFSMVVTPNNALLYVGSATGGIFVYFINSDGSLTTPSTGSQPAGVAAPALTVSPDGKWLIALDGTMNKARLGGNAVVAVSVALAQAAAASRGLPLWRYLAGSAPVSLPLPEIQVSGGGIGSEQGLQADPPGRYRSADPPGPSGRDDTLICPGERPVKTRSRRRCANSEINQ